MGLACMNPQNTEQPMGFYLHKLMKHRTAYGSYLHKLIKHRTANGLYLHKLKDPIFLQCYSTTYSPYLHELKNNLLVAWPIQVIAIHVGTLEHSASLQKLSHSILHKLCLCLSSCCQHTMTTELTSTLFLEGLKPEPVISK